MGNDSRGKTRVAVVTGGSAGIGLAVANRYSDAGYLVHVCDIEPAVESRENIVFTRCDVRSLDQVQHFADVVVESLQSGDCSLEIVVSNAGVNREGDVVSTSITDWDLVLETNLYGGFHVSRAFIPHIDAGGTLVFVASDQSVRPKRNKAAYGVAKAGIVQLSKQIAVDYAPDLRSVSLSPGPVETLMLRRSATTPDTGSVPMGRYGTPAEIAEIVAFVGSRSAGYMTGVNVVVDGGVTL